MAFPACQGNAQKCQNVCYGDTDSLHVAYAIEPGWHSVKTTMIYTQTVPSRTLKQGCSPYDLEADVIDEAMSSPETLSATG